MTIRLRFLVAVCLSAISTCAWTVSDHRGKPHRRWTRATSTARSAHHDFLPVVETPSEGAAASFSSRRLMLQNYVVVPAIVAMGLQGFPTSAAAAEASTDESSSSSQVTDRIFLEIKGVPSSPEPRRIVIGLFGKDAPKSVSMLKSLATVQGLATPCRPKSERTLIKEQLEANKVYSSCKEGENQGVPLQYSTIWRIIKNERIDVGAVSGKFAAREFPDWQEENVSTLKHDAPGVVSVRRGNDGGFGFTIYPGNGNDTRFLDEEHIIVGRVIEGMDVVRELNDVPTIVTSSKLNYMSLTGGSTTKSAPKRSCQYGGPMYCNENKPLNKMSIVNAGIA
jgi:cyclophilin family peptidyl-prolyl cis-trans isomerase